MHHHHLRQHHSRSLPHNLTRNLHFHYLVETEIWSINIYWPRSPKYFKNNILGLIPGIKAYFKCTNFCRQKDLQISWINAGSQKFMTSEIFNSFYLKTKLHSLFIFGWKEGKYKDEMIMLQNFSGLQIQIFNAFQISLMNNTGSEPLCNLAVLTYLVKTFEEYLHWLKNSCSPFYCSPKKWLLDRYVLRFLLAD